MTKKLGAEIDAVLQGIFLNSQMEGMQAFQKCLSHSPELAKLVETVKNGNYEDAYYLFLMPLKEAWEGLLHTALPNNHKAHFLIEKQDFVGAHFEEIVKRKEGTSCCADKERSILGAMLRFLITGKLIKFNYEAQYTYHLPKTVFTTHEDIESFFNGLYDLYYGKPEKYLSCLANLLKEENHEN